MTDLARFMNVSTAAMTGVVDRLVRDGYAKRENDLKDRRAVKVRLTDKGAKIIGNILKIRRESVMKIFGVISQEEREEYINILEHIRGNIEGSNN